MWNGMTSAQIFQVKPEELELCYHWHDGRKVSSKKWGRDHPKLNVANSVNVASMAWLPFILHECASSSQSFEDKFCFGSIWQCHYMHVVCFSLSLSLSLSLFFFFFFFFWLGRGSSRQEVQNLKSQKSQVAKFTKSKVCCTHRKWVLSIFFHFQYIFDRSQQAMVYQLLRHFIHLKFWPTL